MAFVPVPDDIALDGPTSSAPSQGPKFVPVSDDIKLDGPTMETPPADFGAARNFLTGLARVPGLVAGAPRALAVDLPNWLTAKASNVFTGGNMTGADVQREVDKSSLIPDPSRVLPSAEGVDRAVFGGLSTIAGRNVQPYEPTTPLGKIGQAATSALGGGVLDPVADVALLPRLASAIKSAIAGGAAEGTHELFPNSDVLPVVAAVAAHGGTTAAARGGRAAGGVALDAGRQVFAPTRAGTRESAQTLSTVEHHDPASALAQPTAAQLRDAQANTSAATGAIGPGLEPWQAGAQLRGKLQQRVTGLEDARDAATAPFRTARDASTATVDLDPVVSVVNGKLAKAAGPQADAISGALRDLQMPSGAMRTQADQLAASRQAINSRIGVAKRGGDDATVAHLMDIRNALDKQVNAVVPEAGQFTRTFSDLSRPLDAAEHGPVATVLDRDQFNSRYTFPDERIPDLFLRSPATRTDLNQLVSAFGGDRAAAMGALEQHLAGRVQGAMRPDGTLDTAAFDKAMQPYQKAMNGNLGMFFPDVARKFSNAKAAQQTLERMQTQRGLVDAVSTGALRDSSGAITGESFGKFLQSNRSAIADTQSPAAVMRLQSIGNALKVPQGELADALRSEVLPTAAGVAMGGAEGGIIGGMLRHATHAAFGGLDAKRQAAFNAAIEKAVLDPDHAAKLTAEFTKRSRYLSPARALVQAAAATIPSTEAASGLGGR